MVILTKKILVVGAGTYQVPIIRKAKELGLQVIATDYNPEAEGFALCDNYEVLDVKDKQGNLNIARKYKIDGVVSFATEIAVKTVAYVAKEMVLPGVSVEAAHNSTNKIQMRKIFEENNLPTVSFCEISSLETAFEAAEKLGFPFVLKPAESSGSRGVTVITAKNQISEAFTSAQNHATEKLCIAEAFFEGLECTIEGFSNKGEHTILAVSEKKKLETKYRVATELFYPPSFAKNIVNHIKDVINEAVKALGIEIGSTHSEVIVNLETEELIIVEVAARGGGFGISDKIIQYITGFDPVEALIKTAIGEDVSLETLTSNSAILKFFTPTFESAILDKIIIKPGLADVKNTEIEFFIKEGDVIPVLTTDGSRTGSIISWAKTPEEVKKQVQEVESLIEFKLSPLPDSNSKKQKE